MQGSRRAKERTRCAFGVAVENAESRVACRAVGRRRSIRRRVLFSFLLPLVTVEESAQRGVA